jgi:hypothetical protein
MPNVLQEYGKKLTNYKVNILLRHRGMPLWRSKRDKKKRTNENCNIRNLAPDIIFNNTNEQHT